MEENFVERAVLEEAADSLLKMRDYSQLGAEEFKNLREGVIEDLDKKIGDAIFSDLSDDQLDEFETLLDNNGDEDAISAFFEKHNIDLQSRIEKSVQEFKDDFLLKGVE